MQVPHCLRHGFRSLGFDETDDEATQTGDVFRAVTGSYAAAVVIKVPIEEVMAAILDAPMAAVGLEHLLGIGLAGGSAGAAVGEFD